MGPTDEPQAGVPPRVGVGTYLLRERRAEWKSEYVDGDVVAMSGASVPHLRICTNLVVGLGTRLGDRDCDVVASDLRVRVRAANAYFYPDVAVVCGAWRVEDAERDTLLNPQVIVEVLSPSTERRDRGLKRAAYERLDSLAEYVLVAQDRPCVEVFRRDAGWEGETYVGMDARVELRSLGVAPPLGEIYRRVFPRVAG